MRRDETFISRRSFSHLQSCSSSSPHENFEHRLARKIRQSPGRLGYIGAPVFALGYSEKSLMEKIQHPGYKPTDSKRPKVTITALQKNLWFSGDWGELDEADMQENELSIKNGFRILSAYIKMERRFGSLLKLIDQHNDYSPTERVLRWLRIFGCIFVTPALKAGIFYQRPRCR